MPFRTIHGSAERRIAAPAARCLDVAADARGWPEWMSAVRSVNNAEGRLLIEARLIAIPLWFLAEVEEEDDRVTVRRVPFEPGDRERLELVLSLRPDGDACRASAEIDAELDLPRLLPVPPAIADQFAGRLLGDLENEVAE